MGNPETRYAQTDDDVHIAYQVVGDGPVDLLFACGFVFNVEHLWESWPEAARFVRQLAPFSRVIVFDRRGTGLSDHLIRRDEQLTLEARMDDVRAVMDAAGSARAILMGFEVGIICADEGCSSPEPIHRVVLFLYRKCDERCRAEGYMIMPLYG